MSSRFPRALCAACFGFAACSSAHRHADSPPRAELLLTTADSTVWIATTSGQLRVRAAPLILARYGGRYYEVYTADDDRSYDDALLVGERVYRRDILSGDSTIVFADTIVPRVADAYARAHPDEQPLGPNDDGNAQPSTTATADVDVLDVTGPFLSYEYHVELELPSRRTWNVTRRGVIDLRSGQERALADVFGASESRRLTAAARKVYETTRDSIIRVRGSLSGGDRRAADALEHLKFDERSFSLSTLDGQPAVTFGVPGQGAGAAGDLVELDPLVVHENDWWRAYIGGAPTTDGGGNDRWTQPGYSVIARYDTSAGVASLSIADSARREWPIATVTAPVHGIFWLDRPAVSAADRAALVRAFNQAATYDERARVARNAGLSNLYLASTHASDQARLRKSARNLGADDARARQQPGPRVWRRGPVDDGQMRRHRGVPAQPKQRRHRLD
jgi:hypothetical protein